MTRILALQLLASGVIGAMLYAGYMRLVTGIEHVVRADDEEEW